MVIYSVYVISKSGSLIYSYDHTKGENEVEKTFSYPLNLKLKEVNNQFTQVVFGQRDGIKVGHSILAINGETINGINFKENTIINYLNDENNYPVSIKFGKPKLTANEKICLASMFHSMFTIAAVQIYNVKSIDGSSNKSKQISSGIETLETSNFRLNCFQTVTGVKFLIITDLNSTIQKDLLFKKIYKLYSDYALKNPFYSLDMPIRCELFDQNLQQLLEITEKVGLANI